MFNMCYTSTTMKRLSIELKTITDEEIVKQAKVKSAQLGIKLRELVLQALMKFIKK